MNIAIIILLTLVLIFAVFLMTVAIRNFMYYEFSSTEEIQTIHNELNHKAKHIVNMRERKKTKQRKHNGILRRLFGGLTNSNTIPEPIRKAMGYPF